MTAVGISSLSCYYSMILPPQQLKKQSSSYQIRQYVNNNLDTIIQNQEKKLNIAHQGVPVVEVGISDQIKKSFPGLPICGCYDSGENIIYIKKDIIINLEEEIKNVEVSSPGNDCYIKQVIDHELGHFYVDMLSENLGTGSWPQTLTENGTVDKNAIHIIGEGIAEYFGRSMNSHYDNFKDQEWPTKLEDFVNSDNPSIPNYRIWYDGGYHLVKPIIDEFGVKGIMYLMFHPPTEKELLDLQGYQKKILINLSK